MFGMSQLGKPVFLSLVLVLSSLNAVAHEGNKLPEKLEALENYLTIDHIVYEETTITKNSSHTSVMVASTKEDTSKLPGLPNQYGVMDAVQDAGKIISSIKDLVALGEDIYKLITKGRPNITTDYAPISVLPKDKEGKPVDIMELENWSMPVVKKVRTSFKNSWGNEMAVFEYSLVFSHSGSYEGNGAFITAAQIVPSRIQLRWGYDFESTMKLTGIQNHGSRVSPVAGAILGVKYRLLSMLQAIETNDTFHLTGKGDIRKL
jgi:hypothetical protein